MQNPIRSFYDQPFPLSLRPSRNQNAPLPFPAPPFIGGFIAALARCCFLVLRSFSEGGCIAAKRLVFTSPMQTSYSNYIKCHPTPQASPPKNQQHPSRRIPLFSVPFRPARPFAETSATSGFNPTFHVRPENSVACWVLGVRSSPHFYFFSGSCAADIFGGGCFGNAKPSLERISATSSFGST